MDFIDVVNEALHSKPYYKGAIGGDGESGWDWALWTFATARKYAPNAKLLINDYNILKSRSKTDEYLDLISVLMEEGNLDGIGVQAHFLETTDADEIKRNLDLLAETGLPLYVSEFELDIYSDEQHEKRMSEVFPALWEHPAVAGVTVWGYEQGRMWRDNGYLVRSNGTERPGMTWLVKYLEENPLPAPGGSVSIRISNRNQKKHTGPNKIFLGGNVNGPCPGNYVRIYGLDGKLIDYGSAEYVTTSHLAASPYILIPGETVRDPE